MLFNKIYVVVSKDNIKSYDKKKSQLTKLNVPVLSWNKIDNTKSSSLSLTAACSALCSDDMIKLYYSHYSLWKNIVDNKEDRIMIIDENAKLVDNFSEKIVKLWDPIPFDWDIIFLNDSLDKPTCSDTDILVPKYPTGLYGYIVTYDSAKKMVEYMNSTIPYNINFMINNIGLKFYSFCQQLVKPIKKRKRILHHELIYPLTGYLEKDLGNIRSLDIKLTYYILLFIIISLLIGCFCDNKSKNLYLVCMFGIILFELSFTKITINKIKSLALEIFVIILFFAVGAKSKQISA